MPELKFEQKFQVAAEIHRHIYKYYFPDSDSVDDDPVAPVTSDMEEIIDAFITDFASGEYKEGKHYFVDEYSRKDEKGKVVSTSRTVRLLKETTKEGVTTGIEGLKHPYLFIDGIGYQRVEKELGRGGFGVVAEAFDQTEKKVAIKQSLGSVKPDAYEADIEPAKQMGMLEQSAMLREKITLIVMPLIEGFELTHLVASETKDFEHAIRTQHVLRHKSRLRDTVDLGKGLGKISLDDYMAMMKRFEVFYHESSHAEQISLKEALQFDEIVLAFYTKELNIKGINSPREDDIAKFKTLLGKVATHFLEESTNQISDPHEILKICLGAAEKVNLLHSKQYIHRDIKGENFIYDKKDGQVYLLDYGTALHEDKAKDVTLAEGTDPYMAPETKGLARNIWLHGGPSDCEDSISVESSKKSDVYSFGRFLELDMGLRRSDLCGMVANILSRDPSERPSMEHIIKRLQHYKDNDLPVSATPEEFLDTLEGKTAREKYALIDEHSYDIAQPPKPMTAAQLSDTLKALSEPPDESPLSAVKQQCIAAIKAELHDASELLVSVKAAELVDVLKQGGREQLALIDENLYDIAN